jgi:hypothetical protein
MPLYHDKNWWLNYFIDNLYNLGPHITGNVLLPYGQQELIVPVDPIRVVQQVFLHADPGSSIPVCYGDLNYLGCVSREHDFTIYANIKSNYAYVYWIVIFDGGP